MPNLIFHHYPTSPFSEKIRLIFGFKKLQWQSVIIPMIMPKDDVVALTGGYRKTPVLQIGADVYCDTALIADVVDSLHPAPPLYPDAAGAAARVLAQWADSTLFWTAIPYAFQPAGMQAMFGNVPPEHAQAFIADRKVFRGNAPRMAPGEATSGMLIYLDRIERMLHDGRAFLLGSEKTIADFSVYHSIWFIRRAGPLAQILEPFARVAEWAVRMKAIGHGESTDLTSAAALDIARNSTPLAPSSPAARDTHGLTPGERVRIAPTDYGIDPVEGELVFAGANEWAIMRADPRAGDVVVHFPRLGFQLTRAA